MNILLMETDILLYNAGLSKLEVAEAACSQEPGVVNACLIIQGNLRTLMLCSIILL